MRPAGRVVGEVLAMLREAVRPGISTAELDELAERHIRQAGAVPAFKGYHGFPATLCTSVNDEVIHGIPGERVLEAGDVISIDCGAVLDGYYGLNLNQDQPKLHESSRFNIYNNSFYM